MQRLIDKASDLLTASLTELAAVRASKNQIQIAGWMCDVSRQRLDEEAEHLLAELSRDAGLARAINGLFEGETVNVSENRAALHWALRSIEQDHIPAAAHEVRKTVEPALDFAGEVLTGLRRSASGETYKHIVHIGIGGSDFGPRLLMNAFELERMRKIEVRFCANVDPVDLERALDGINPRRTLVIGVSKSFRTSETLYNLERARTWLSSACGDDWSKNMALVTANDEKARAWLSDRDASMFHMPETVGGRFSLWSAAGLACMIGLGPPAFRAFLSGAREMDKHVREQPLETNLAAQLALLDYWNATVLDTPMRVVLAYSNRLRLLPTYLQQLEMESNGKSVRPDGAAITGMTAPAVWGGEGSIGQHSYHQWLQQGTHSVATEFVLAPDPSGDEVGKRELTAHALAQAEVLANGRSSEEIRAEEPELSDASVRQKVHLGGQPSVFMSCRSFSYESLGALIALYEHRTYLAGQLWGLNSFDQWGVERGKTIAAELARVLKDGDQAADFATQQITQHL